IHNGMPCRFSCCRDETELIDPELTESFLNYPPLDQMPNPITILNIQQHQFQDVGLNVMRQNNPYRFPVKEIQGRPVICYRERENDPEGSWKIALPTELMQPTLIWYHFVLGHCGVHRLYDTVRSRFFAPGLKRLCDEFRCDDCQRNKLYGAGYGHLPARNAPLIPWNEVQVDLIGPWTLKIQGDPVEFNALTCIDPVTNLLEIVLIDNKTSEHVAQKFQNVWLARYPRPNRCIHDNGGEFTGIAFRMMLEQAGIQDVPTTVKNPQANSICERVHQTIANILRATVNTIPPLNYQAAVQTVEDALSTAMHSTRCAVSRSIGVSPGALVFQRDMFVDLPLVADLVTIRDRRQILIDENLRRQNKKRREWIYEVGQRVLIKADDPTKMEPRAHGPYTVVQVFTNGTVAVRRNAHVVERMNIRRLIPFRQH
ncbi:MAG: integrase zinc binding domain-containing protein, partial [Marinobacter adhaerens]